MLLVGMETKFLNPQNIMELHSRNQLQQSYLCCVWHKLPGSRSTLGFADIANSR